MIPFSTLNGNSGDIDLSLGLRFTSDIKTYVVQRLDENLSFFHGEWFLDLRLGIPYFERVIGQKPDFALIDALFRRAALLTPGVGAVPNFQTTFDRATRKASPKFTIALKDGEQITQADLRANFIVNY